MSKPIDISAFDEATKGIDISGFDSTEESPRELESFLRGGAQTGSFGFADEVTAALEKLATGKPYEQALAESRQAYKRAQEENPWSYGTGGVTGAVASSIVPGSLLARAGMAAKLPGVIKAGKFLNLGADAGLLKTAGSAATQGAITGAGEAEGDRVKGAGLGGLIGGAGGAIGYGLAKGAETGGKKLYKWAFREADEVAKRYKKKVLPSTTAWNHQITGSESGIEGGVSDVLDTLMQKREKLLQDADKAGATVDVDRALAPVKKKAMQWLDLSSSAKEVKNPSRRAAAESILRYSDEATSLARGMEPTAYKPTTITRKTVFPKPQGIPPEPKPTGKMVEVGKKYVEAPNMPEEAFVPTDLGLGFEPRQGAYPSGIKGDWESIQAYIMSEGAKKEPKQVLKQMVEKRIKGAPYQRGFSPANASQLSDIKSSTYSDIGKEGYDKLMKSSEGKELLKLFGRGLKVETERAANKALPGTGKALRNINEDIGSLLTARGVFGKDVMKEARRLGISEVDMMSLGVSPELFALKQVGKVAKSKWAQTKGGKALHKFGKSTVMEKGLGRVLPALLQYQEDAEPTFNLRGE